MSKPPPSYTPPRGMRDFYPEDMRTRDRIFSAWTEAARRCGFQRYDACVVEKLDWLERKSGEELSAQIYAFTDKSGRRLALRPEMTPTLARMILARQGELAFPIKWQTIAQCFRYERMTRGRKREHYQWNLDIVGAEELLAEAEILFAAVTAMRLMGVPDDAWRIHLGNRALLGELLETLEVPRDHHAAAFLALDKRGKQSDAEIADLLEREGIPSATAQRVFEILRIDSLDAAREIVGPGSPALARIEDLMNLLPAYGIADRTRFDISVIRGLDYYSDIVFEAFDTDRRLRAIFGGGRYNGLLDRLGGPPRSAVGLGFGDVVIGELLAETGVGAERAGDREAGCLVGFMQPEQRATAAALAGSMRRNGQVVDLALAPQKPRAFFKAAGKSRLRHAIFIGPDDVETRHARRKDLATREESTIALPGEDGSFPDPKR